jgi:hypothetical protein
MDVPAETLNARLHEWKPETAAQVRERVAEIIGLADQDVLDLMRSRTVEQDVLDILDEPPVAGQNKSAAEAVAHIRESRKGIKLGGSRAEQKRTGPNER